ncbi:MAG: DUF1801 domain-containing protein [Ignavibacteriae bacterium]|nr:DUF1801 domain-containing protein [Ignavibacteriota bacterium]
MKAPADTPTTIDEYIAGFPPEVRPLLEKVRAIIRAAAPDAVETIKYQIPTYVLNGNLVHFGGFKKHIGLYPGAEATTVFAQDLAAYKTSKGAIQFPIDAPIPTTLIRRIVKHRVKEARAKTGKK